MRAGGREAARKVRRGNTRSPHTSLWRFARKYLVPSRQPTRNEALVLDAYLAIRERGRMPWVFSSSAWVGPATLPEPNALQSRGERRGRRKLAMGGGGCLSTGCVNRTSMISGPRKVVVSEGVDFGEGPIGIPL